MTCWCGNCCFVPVANTVMWHFTTQKSAKCWSGKLVRCKVDKQLLVWIAPDHISKTTVSQYTKIASRHQNCINPSTFFYNMMQFISKKYHQLNKISYLSQEKVLLQSERLWITTYAFSFRICYCALIKYCLWIGMHNNRAKSWKYHGFPKMYTWLEWEGNFLQFHLHLPTYGFLASM